MVKGQKDSKSTVGKKRKENYLFNQSTTSKFSADGAADAAPPCVNENVSVCAISEKSQNEGKENFMKSIRRVISEDSDNITYHFRGALNLFHKWQKECSYRKEIKIDYSNIEKSEYSNGDILIWFSIGSRENIRDRMRYFYDKETNEIALSIDVYGRNGFMCRDENPLSKEDLTQELSKIVGEKSQNEQKKYMNQIRKN